jgi:hypothetical protein
VRQPQANRQHRDRDQQSGDRAAPVRAFFGIGHDRIGSKTLATFIGRELVPPSIVTPEFGGSILQHRPD